MRSNLFPMLRTLLLLPVLLLSFLLTAQVTQPGFEKEWKQIDRLINNKDLPQTALKKVRALYKQAKAGHLTTQMLKCRLYEFSLSDKTEDANPARNIQQLRADINTVNDPLTLALTHAIIAKRLYDYLLSHRYEILRRSETKMRPDPADFSSWSSTDFVQATELAWNKALSYAETLKKTSIDSASPLLYEGNQPSVQSSLFDLLAWEALEFYQSGENMNKHFSSSPLMKDTACFSEPDVFLHIPIDKKDSSFFGKTIGLYQSLLRLHRKDPSPDALIALQIKYLEWLRYASTVPDKEDLYAKELQRIVTNWGNTQQAVPAWEQLVSLHIQKASQYGRLQWSGRGGNPFRDTRFRWEYKIAAAILQEALDRLPKDSLLIGGLLNLQNSIHATELSLTTEQVVIPGRPFLGSLQFRNIDTLYFHLIKLQPGTILSDKINEGTWQTDYWKNWINKTAIKEWMQALPVTNDFQQHATEIKLPGLPAGEYALLCSGSKDFSLAGKALAIRFFTASSLSLIRNNTDYFVLDRATGFPVSGARVVIQQIKQVYTMPEARNVLDTIGTPFTDQNGYFRFAANGAVSLRFTILKGNDRLYLNGAGYSVPDEEELPESLQTELHKKTPERKSVFFFRDRGIYRPGQTVQFKGIIVSTDNKTQTNRIYTYSDSVWVYLRNAGYERIDSLRLPVSRYGSLYGRFLLPEQTLNGGFQLEIPGMISSNNYFLVESYKSPRFYVKLYQPENTYKLLDTIHVKGIARAFAGYPLSGATVQYHITRIRQLFQPYRTYVPRVSQTVMVAEGSLPVDQQGNFQIRFPLSVDDLSDSLQYPSFTYQLSADITDINGETHSASLELNAGITSMRLILSAMSPLNADSTIHVSVLTLNSANKVIPATVHLKVFPLEKPFPVIQNRLWAAPDVYSIPEALFRADFPYDEYRNESDPATWKSGKAVLEEDWQVTSSQGWTIAPHKLSPGEYCIEATVNDGAGHELKQNIYTELFHPNEPYKVGNQILLPVRGIINPGDSIQLYSGSAIPSRFVITKTIYGNTRKQTLQFDKRNAEVSGSVLKISPNFSGWINRSETFVFQNRLYSIEQPILVSLPDKKLQVTYSSYRNKTEPGSTENWTIQVRNNHGPVDSAEIVSTLYDASMDAVATNSWPYIAYTSYAHSTSIFSDLHNFNFGSDYNHLSSEKFFPTQRFIYARLIESFYEFSGLRNHSLIPISTGVDQVNRPVLTGKIATLSGRGLRGQKSELDDSRSEALKEETMYEPARPAPVSNTNGTEQVRKNFAETAFFLPALYTDTAGNCSIKFNMPESATTWKWLSFVHTKGLATGFQSASITTAKPFLVQPNMPRFLREGDRFELLAKIVNQSDSEVTGQVTLELIDAGSGHSVDGWFQNVFPTQYFTAEAGNSIVIKFPVQVPFSFNRPLRWRIVARGKQFSDGEENTIAVISRRMLITDSKPIFLEKDSTVHISLPGLNNPNNENFTPVALTVQYQTNPVWEVAQALPSLLLSTYPGTMYAFNRFYAQTLGAWILHTQPGVASLIQSWKDQNKFPPSPLETNTALKNVLLQETPWVLDALSETAQHQRLAALLDSNLIRKDQESYIRQLIHDQLPNGAFTWMPGGRPDNYITLRLLTDLGKLKLSGALTKQQVLQLSVVFKKGIAYVDTIMAEQYRQQLKSGIKEPGATYQWEYLYMHSFFPEFTVSKLPVWRYYYQSALKKATQQSVYYKAMLSLVFARNGDVSIVRRELLPSVRENATISEKGVMYWKQLTIPSYFNDAIARQSMLIYCFQELERNISDAHLSNDITRMKTWLLLQKHQNRWLYSVSAADACYAVLQGSVSWLTDKQDIRLQVGDISVGRDFLSSLDTTGGFEYRIPGDKIQQGMGNITLQRKSGNTTPGIGAVYWQYFDAMDQVEPAGGILKVTKQLFVEREEKNGSLLDPVTEQTILKPGDKLVTRLHLQSGEDMDYVHLKDLRASCLEPETVISGYRWKPGISYYQSASDVSMHFFIDHLDKGSYDIEYTSRVTHIGSFATGIANATCLYAPELQAHSGSSTIRVEE